MSTVTRALVCAAVPVVLTVPATAASAATRFKPVADAYVRADNPKKNFGTAKTLRVDGSPRIVTYLRFSLSGVSGSVTNATLRLNAKDRLATGADVRPVADIGWSETKLTWSNAPETGAIAASSGPVTRTGWVAFDVTRLVRGNGQLALGVTTGGSNAMDMSSRESGSNAPQLIVTVDTTPPARPTGLQAISGDGSVRLAWTPNTTDSDLSGYRVYRRTSGGAWALLAPAAEASFVDTGAANDVTYEYRVTAVDISGNESAASSVVTATPKDMTPPAAPTGIDAVAGDGKVTLRWSAGPEADLVGYRVYRRVSGGAWASNSLAAPTTAAFVDGSVTNGTTYEYRITAMDANGNESSPSDVVSVTPADRTPPAAPTGLQATADDGSILLQWTANTEEDLVGYRVYRRASDQAWPDAPVASPMHPTFADGGVENGTTYEYRVTAIDTHNNESAPSDVVAATPAAPIPRTGTAQRGIWMTTAEIAHLPMAGSAWSSLKTTADASSGTANISDQNSNHDVRTLAAALVFARTQEPSYRVKAAAAIAAAIGTEQVGRTLALARNLLAYVVAADLIELGLYDVDLDARFRSWLAAVRTTRLDGKTLISTHEIRPNNWGTLAGASRIAADVYLGDTSDIARAATVFGGWLGDRSAYAGFVHGDLAWQSDPAQPVGINPVGATIQGYDVDGALPEELRRGCTFQVPPCSTAYTWEALQGAVAQAHMLARLGYDTWSWSDRALLRAAQFLHRLDQEHGGWWATGDDKWVPWVLNRAYGTTFPTADVSMAGKGMGWTDWMLAPG